MKTYAKVLIGMGSSMAAGIILGLLYAPDKGSETRRKISDATSDYSNRYKTIRDALTGKVKVTQNGHDKTRRTRA